MNKERKLTVKAFTCDRDSYIRGFSPPIECYSDLIHEIAHVLNNMHKFRSSRILRPYDIRSAKISIEPDLRARLLTLASTNQPQEKWQEDIRETAHKVYTKLTKATYDPNCVNIHFINTPEEFDDLVKKFNFNLNKLTEVSYRQEVPAYYMQYGGKIILENTLSSDTESVKLDQQRPAPMTSHGIALSVVQALYKGNAFPTPRILGTYWRQHTRLLADPHAPELIAANVHNT